MSTRSAASSPWDRPSVTTTATGSPTYRTTPRASSGWPICGLMTSGIRRRLHRQAGQVGAGERGDDSGGLQRGTEVDGTDPRVRDSGPDEVHMAGARPLLVLHVGGVDAAGGQEAGVLCPHDPGTENPHPSDLAWPDG